MRIDVFVLFLQPCAVIPNLSMYPGEALNEKRAPGEKGGGGGCQKSYRQSRCFSRLLVAAFSIFPKGCFRFRRVLRVC